MSRHYISLRCNKCCEHRLNDALLFTLCYLWCCTYSAVDHVHVNISLFGPFVPEVGVIQRDVCAVSRSHETSLKADIRITSNHNHICLSSWAAPGQTYKNSQRPVSLVLEQFVLIFFFHLSKGGSSSLRLNGDGLRSTLEDLVDILLTEFGPFILLIHDGPVCTTSQQILNLLLRELLLHSLRGKKKDGWTWIKKLYTTNKNE